jgi:pilus assembly protein CpaE
MSRVDSIVGGAGAAEDAAATFRTDRKPLICFATDAETEATLREGFADAAPAGSEFRRGDIAVAIAALRGMPTPWTLLVDLSGHPQPFAALDDLSEVVEPDVRVLVIGDRTDLGFYRHLTRNVGVADYLYKPLTAALVAENFGPVVARRRPERAARGGRLLTLTGARGGVGCSTLTCNLAWYLADTAKRHSLALDADLQRGTLALMLAAEAGGGLRTALEQPARLDELFVDRTAHAVNDRLHVLAAEETLTSPIAYAAGAAERLIGLARRRYNFIIADVPFQPTGLAQELLDTAQQRIIVMEPTLPCVRDALRLMMLPQGSGQASRPLLVLNRAGRPGGLPTARIAEAMKQQPDVIVPDQPRRVEEGVTMGQAVTGPFRDAIARIAVACGAAATPVTTRSRLMRLLGR